MFTSHGHHISGTVLEGQPINIARCGGPKLCQTCGEESFMVQSAETMTYQRRTIKADAVRFDGTRAGAIRVMDWVATVGHTVDWNPIRKILIIESPENSATAEIGDWVIFEKGNFYVKSDDEFDAGYEKITTV